MASENFSEGMQMGLAKRLREDRQRRKQVFEGKKQQVRADWDADKARHKQSRDAARAKRDASKARAEDQSPERTADTSKLAQPAVTPEAIAGRKAEQDRKARRNGLVFACVIAAVVVGFVLAGLSDDADDSEAASELASEDVASPGLEPEPQPDPKPDPSSEPRPDYSDLWEESAGGALAFYGEDPISLAEDLEMGMAQRSVRNITGYDWSGGYGFVRTDLHPDNPDTAGIAESLCNVATTGLFGTELLDEVIWVEVTGQHDRRLATCKPIGQR